MSTPRTESSSLARRLRLLPVRPAEADERYQPVLLAALMAAGFAWLLVRTVILAAHSLHWGLVLDSPQFHYIAWRILEGTRPTAISGT